MKLSHVLNLFWVLPLNQSVLVDYYIDEDAEDYDTKPITITWDDPGTREEYFQVFEDQEVRMGVPSVIGEFLVDDTEGNTVSFVAVRGVPQERLFAKT